jgi:hypothetical protein
MFIRTILVCLTLASLPVTYWAWPQQVSTRPINIMVEGEESSTRSMIEALQRVNAKYDIKFEFVNDAAAPYDLRLQVSDKKYTYTRYCNCDDDDPSKEEEVVAYSASAHAFTADGNSLFRIYRSSESYLVIENTATEVIKNIYRDYYSIRHESDSGDSFSRDTLKETSSWIEPEVAVKTAVEKALKEPGFYYKDGTNWVQFEEKHPDTQMRGFAKAMLTFGLSKLRYYDVLSGASAKVQISETKPVFYVRGYPISEQDLAIVKLEQVKDHREVELTNKERKPKVSYSLKATRISDVIYKLVPQEELPAGEYMVDLFLSDTVTSVREFGIAPVKK